MGFVYWICATILKLWLKLGTGRYFITSSAIKYKIKLPPNRIISYTHS